ncbi:hypothetical protein [Dyella acidisoli]|uniref:hypothetical protein n=1 Tax=Dyella acidisoli TaxID=1867834 RepID=UPI0024E0769C|nr:hypothetical protein [Dyella acidisoli]
MRSLLHLAKRFLAKHPTLRRKIVNAIYRVPVLDMRLRTALDSNDEPAHQRIDPNNLPEEVQVVYERLRNRVKRS